MRMQRVCILGGSGFVGRHLANRLHDQAIHSRIPTRRRERTKQILVVPGLELVEADIHEPETLRELFAECDAVINLVGILNEKGFDGSGFHHAHVELTDKVLDACRATGVTRLLHMSALGADADNGPSFYQKTKGEAERRVLAADDLDVTVFRPSVIFGPDDSFFNQFATLLRLSPGVFPLPSPRARFSPVYVGDVAQAFTDALTDRDTFGQVYDLCGPDTYSLQELVRYTADKAGLCRAVWPLGDRLSRLQARVLQRVPGKPYSMDNFLSATVDNVCSVNNLPELGIKPTAIDAVVPAYLASKTERARYNQFRQAAGR
ncbi:complex I NDUFA9 subunit family protein [Aquisalimonas asiatica]|uniref:NADH dehydrogenase n=1 Tax=Aquisalimonas asiatica TaxID=406100 RepID=A0A1H8V683_9GAMM|nr:complex I NDUFA9 subunit family protein [Aquisalimonas asiatica]SEP10851.1 NADH dehydrogenase [Aquisalimonas asiatica]